MFARDTRIDRSKSSVRCLEQKKKDTYWKEYRQVLVMLPYCVCVLLKIFYVFSMTVCLRLRFFSFSKSFDFDFFGFECVFKRNANVFVSEQVCVCDGGVVEEEVLLVQKNKFLYLQQFLHTPEMY